MKIAIVTYCLHIGGVERFVYNVSKFFLQRGYEAEVIEAENEGEWKSYFIDSEIPVKTFPINFLTIPYWHSRKLGKKLRKYDILFLIDIPFAQAALGMLNEDTVCYPVIELSIPSMYKNAISNSSQWNNIVAVSNQIRDILILDYKIEPSIIKMIPNAIRIGKYPFKDFSFDHKIKIVFVGRIEDKQKGVFLLPDIIKGLTSEYPQIDLTVIGDGPDLQRLKDNVVKTDLIQTVHFTGSLSNEQVIEELRKFHFLLMPSNHEGLPFVLLEAMSCGVVPIASYLPGITDMVIKDGFNGYLAKPREVTSFIYAINKAIVNKNNLMTISENAYNTVLNNYSIEKVGGIFLELINLGKNKITKRSNIIDIKTLGYDYPFLPIILGKAFSKIKRLSGISQVI